MKSAAMKPFLVTTPSDLQTHWSRLRAVILKAIPFMGGTHSEADLIAACLDGRMTFWASANSFSLASIDKQPRLTRVHWLLAGGDPVEADRIGDMIASWGKEHGAAEMITAVRPGVERHNDRNPHERMSRGWKKSRVLYVKEI